MSPQKIHCVDSICSFNCIIHSAFILLEYLGESANLKDSLSKDQMDSLLDIMARMHCHAFLHHDLWKGRYDPINVAEMEKSRLRMAAYVFKMIRVSKCALFSLT